MFDPLNASLEYGVFLASTVCHEAAHAFCAKRLGDSTAERSGQVSLNPIPHIRREPLGMVVVPLFGLLSGGAFLGWASTPYSLEWARKSPKSEAWMALAGPAANLTLLAAAAAAIRLGVAAGIFVPAERLDFAHVAAGATGPWSDVDAAIVSAAFTMNLLLGIFNLLPFGPMDGSKAVAFLPGGEAVRNAMASRGARMAGLMAAWLLFPYIFHPALLMAVNLLFPGANYH